LLRKLVRQRFADGTDYLAQLRAGERSTSRGYRDWASTQDHAPVMTTVQLHGGWEAVRRDALGRAAGPRAK
jgi:hypothetical protein